MTATIHLGIDLGSTAVRVAWSPDAESEPRLLPADSSGPLPRLPCEHDGGGCPGFPGVKSRLGGGGASKAGRGTAAAGEVRELLAAVRRAAEEASSGRVGRTAIAVPAWLGTSGRTELSAAARESGLGEVLLINDTLGAVLARCDPDHPPVTLLVYAMGYDGFEIGLVRAAGGRYRALGYETGRFPSGRHLDAMLLTGLLVSCEAAGLPLVTAHTRSRRWRELRRRAEGIKERLSRRDWVALSVGDADGRRAQILTFSRSQLEEQLTPEFAATLERARALLAQTGLTVADVDRVLLVGGSTRIPLVQRLVGEAFERSPELLADHEPAIGAVRYALRLEPDRSVAAESGDERRGLETGVTGIAGRLRPTVRPADGDAADAEDEPMLQAESPGAAPDAAAAGSPLVHARRLIEQGRGDAARSFLDALIEEARGLRESIPAADAGAESSADVFLARRALARARKMLDKGEYERAVRQSHVAWKTCREDPDVFEQMIGVHCDAAIANDSAAGYDDAVRWLRCAYRHDGSNARVRQLIADLHYGQGRRLSEGDRRSEALEKVELCLAWDPEHVDARSLQERLGRR